MDESLTDAMRRRWREGKLDLGDLAEAATVRVWAHDALSEIDPDNAATIPRPKRPRGADPYRNAMRDAEICGELNGRMSMGEGLRSACRAVSANRDMLSPSAVAKIWAKSLKPAFPKYRRYSVRREGDSAIRIMKL